jgi:hypothetical protein
MRVVYSRIASPGQSSVQLKNPRRPSRIWNKLTVAPGNIFSRKSGLDLLERNSTGAVAMDRETQFANELETLRALCDESITRESRQRLMQSLVQVAFIEPQHQVVFESICALFPRGPISGAQLRVHLNNRGFPDTDVEKYFQPATAGTTQRERTGKITS